MHTGVRGRATFERQAYKGPSRKLIRDAGRRPPAQVIKDAIELFGGDVRIMSLVKCRASLAPGSVVPIIIGCTLRAYT